MKNYLMVSKNKLRDSLKIHRKVQDEKSGKMSGNMDNFTDFKIHLMDATKGQK